MQTFEIKIIPRTPAGTADVLNFLHRCRDEHPEDFILVEEIVTDEETHA